MDKKEILIKKILIADDEVNIRSLVRRFLGNKYIVLEATNGEVAVYIARKQKPDLILMDIMMPKLDGYGACRAIKQDPVTKAIPIVMLSGVGHELNKKFANKMGASGYITKPFSSQDLLDAIAQFLKSPK